MLKGHGADAHLEATHLTSFTTARSLMCKNVSLYGLRYARAVIYADLGQCVEIFDWSASNLQELRKTAINEPCVGAVIDGL